MPLLQSTLKSQIEAVGLKDTEAEAMLAWADVYATYFSGATANGVPANPGVIELAKAAMLGALTGLGMTGAVALQTGITAFWGLVTPAMFAGSIAAAPAPGLAGLSAALTAAFAANTAGQLEAGPAADTIATAIHVASLGGTATFPPSLVAPIL